VNVRVTPLVAFFVCIPLMPTPSNARPQAATSPKPSIVVTQTPQPDAPLRIVSLTQNAFDALSIITVENSSEKTIASFQLGWVTVVPAGCADKASDSVVTLAPVDEANIEPGQSWKSGSYRLSLKGLASTARTSNASLIHVQVGIVAVTFSDGSHWKFDLQKNKIFDQRLVEFESSRCSAGTQNQACPASTVTESVTSGIRNVGGPTPDFVFHCVDSEQIHTSCQAEENMCTTKRCTILSECPNQICQAN
jgi:hypothetical protein